MYIVSPSTDKEAEVQKFYDLAKVRSLAPGRLDSAPLTGLKNHSLPLFPLLLIKTSMGPTGDQRVQQICEDSLDGAVIAE